MGKKVNMKHSTMIGSLPYKEPKKAVEIVVQNLSLPAWPQLPKKSFKEQMHVQYTENFPGIILDEQNEKVWIDTEKFNSEITDFYQNFVDNQIEYFKISELYANGFYEFVNQLSNSNFFSIKLQTIGPITFGLTIKTQSGKAILYDEQIKDAVIKVIIMKSVWQIKKVLECKTKVKEIILFLDEPYLSAYGSAFTSISKEEVVSYLNETILEIKNFVKEKLENNLKILFGVHCCGNTDWGLLTDSMIDIISFDAHDFFTDFVLYSENIKKFVNENKIIAWGIVPNNNKIVFENAELLLNKLKTGIETLTKKGIDEKKLLNNIIITPQCGLGNVSEKECEEIGVKILQSCTELISKI
jgi:hypothetical protein